MNKRDILHVVLTVLVLFVLVEILKASMPLLMICLLLFLVVYFGRIYWRELCESSKEKKKRERL
jgi:predicted membrane protein